MACWPAKTLELTIRNDTGDVIHEKWVLYSVNAHKPFYAETLKVEPQKWTPVPLPKEAKGLLRLQIKGARQPRGVFGSRKAPPQLPSEKTEDFDMPLSQAALSYPAPDLPSYFDREGLPVWVTQDGELPKGAEPIDEDMVFWFIDDADIAELLQMEFRWVNIFPGGFEIECDPFVDINVTPSRIAPGEEVTITVTASASAGIRDYTWNTVCDARLNRRRYEPKWRWPRDRQWQLAAAVLDARILSVSRGCERYEQSSKPGAALRR